ncbi:MAG: PIG-L deacetylase family protein [Ornithinimicrobium sp.]
MTDQHPMDEVEPTMDAPAIRNLRDEQPGMSAPEGVQVQLGPPNPVVLVLGDVDATAARRTLERMHCQLIAVDPEQALDAATALGGFALLLLGPDVVEHEDRDQLLRALRTFSPSSRALLLSPLESVPPRVWVEAIRAGIDDVVDPEDDVSLNRTIERLGQEAFRRAERVLAIGAHPDDVEIGCAGTLLGHRRRGDSVSILTMSQGGVGGNRQQRVHEAVAVAQFVGAQLLFSDLPDTRIDPGVDTIRLIEDVVGELDPTVIYVHSKNDGHQDHRAVHQATMSASRRVAKVLAYQSPSATNDFSPTKFFAIDAVVARKVQALSLYASQGERSYLEPEMVIAGARYWARHLAPRAKYAEPFEVMRSLMDWNPEDTSSQPTTRPVAPVLPISAGLGSAP